MTTIEPRHGKTTAPASVGCCDLIILILLIIFYDKSEGEQCGDGEHNRRYLLAGILIIVLWIALRVLSCFCVCILKRCGENFIGLLNLVLLGGSWVYFVVILNRFFKDKDECKDDAKNIYYGMLILTIYAFITFIVMGLLVLLLWCVCLFGRKQ